MARICIVSRTLSNALCETAKSLAQQKHDIAILTQKKCHIPEGFQLPVMRYFRTWGFLETLRILPTLLTYEIVHFFFQDVDEGPGTAQILMATAVHNVPNRTVAATFWNPLPRKHKAWMRLFLAQCDIVTTDSRSSLMYAKRELHLQNQAATQIYLPQEAPPKQGALVRDALAKFDSDLIKLAENLRPFLFVPQSAQIDPHPELPINVLFSGNRRFSYRSRVFACGDLSEQELDFVISQSKAVLLSVGNHSPWALKTFQKLAFQNQVPLIVSESQQEFLPGLVRPRQSGWIIRNQGWDEVLRFLEDHPHLALDKNVTSWKQDILSQTPDQNLNQLNRLYRRAHVTRWG